MNVIENIEIQKQPFFADVLLTLPKKKVLNLRPKNDTFKRVARIHSTGGGLFGLELEELNLI